MANKKGRPLGHKLSEETKERIRRSRINRVHSQETKDRISKALINYFNDDGISKLLKFVRFATNYIIKAHRTCNRNPIMSEIVTEFCELMNTKPAHINMYAVKYRVALEKHNYICMASVTNQDRRYRYITPTSLFPSRGDIQQIKILEETAVEYIREFYRNKSR